MEYSRYDQKTSYRMDKQTWGCLDIRSRDQKLDKTCDQSINQSLIEVVNFTWVIC